MEKIFYLQSKNIPKTFLCVGYSEPTPTNAPTWMDGELIGLSFLSMCHPKLIFLVCPFSALILVFFATLFSPPSPFSFFFFCL